MDDFTREKLLKITLVTFGAIFFTIYPLSLVLAVGMAVAQWPWPILFPDDLRGLRGSRRLSDCCGA